MNAQSAFLRAAPLVATGLVLVLFVTFTAPFTAQGQMKSGRAPLELRAPRMESAETPEIERSGPLLSSPTLPSGGVKTSATSEPAPVSSAAVESSNLILNPSLEDTDPSGLPTSWSKGGYGTNVRTLTYPVAGNTGAKAAQVTITSYTSGDAKWYFQKVPVTPGETYLFSNYSLANVPSEIDIEFTKSDGTRSYKVLAVVPASASYQQVSGQFVVPAGVVSLTAFHVINRVGSLTVDDYSLTKIDDGGGTPPPPSSSNPVPNGDLETAGTSGNPASWGRGGYGTNNRVFTYPVTGVSGSKAAQVSVTSYTSGDAKWHFTPIVLPAGTYTYSNQYYSTGPSVIVAQYHNANGSYTYKDLKVIPLASAFTLASATFTVPSGTQDVTIFHSLTGAGTLTIDNIAISSSGSVGGIFETGAVTFRIDDGLINHYTVAAPKLESKGFKGTFYIATRQLRDFGFTGYMSQAEVKDTHNRGHEIGGHTRTHADLARLSSEQQRQEIQGSRDDLFALGITPVDAFSYPFGSYTATTIGIVRDVGFTSAASTINGLARPSDDHYQLPRRGIRVETSVAQMKAWVDEAIAQKLWLILTFHGIDYSGDAYTTTPEKFGEIVDYVAAKGAPVVTIAQGMAYMNP